jgi:hypothetical protein
MSDRRPPKKRKGGALGPRRLDGALLDVSSAARWLGCTEATLRARVARHQVPHRRWHGRLVFVKTELERFVLALDGVGVQEAVERERACRKAAG